MTQSTPQIIEALPELPPIEIGDSVQVEEIVAVTRRLTELLAEESMHLRAMRIKPVATLKEEKNRLIGWLEAQQKIIAINPSMRDSMSEEEREVIASIGAEFAQAVEENYHQASIARAVNQRVVQAMMEAVRDQHALPLYSASGAQARPTSGSSYQLNLNQQA